VIVDPVGIRGSWTSVLLTLPLEIHRPRPFFSVVHGMLLTALAIEKARAMGFMLFMNKLDEVTFDRWILISCLRQISLIDQGFSPTNQTA
jgi:hypothetical protein